MHGSLGFIINNHLALRVEPEDIIDHYNWVFIIVCSLNINDFLHRNPLSNYMQTVVPDQIQVAPDQIQVAPDQNQEAAARVK